MDVTAVVTKVVSVEKERGSNVGCGTGGKGRLTESRRTIPSAETAARCMPVKGRLASVLLNAQTIQHI